MCLPARLRFRQVICDWTIWRQVVLKRHNMYTKFYGRRSAVSEAETVPTMVVMILFDLLGWNYVKY